MITYDPVTIEAIDDEGNSLFKYAVPFEMKISALQLMERAFVLVQQVSPKPDPFLYTVEYYGYSQSAQFPGYLGYEIESIGNLQNSDTGYWELLLNGQVSSTGADTTYPNPGGLILWKYLTIPAENEAASNRARMIQTRKSAP